MEKKRGNYRYQKYSKKQHEIAESNPVLQMFQQFSHELDDKHDRYERIVKLSRDITIESKRVIFLLHSQDTDKETKRAGILQEAENRLDSLVNNQFRAIATELINKDHYQYLRAYTAGLQEFVEALLFLQYIRNGTIEKCAGINEKLQFSTAINENDTKYALLFPELEFILGLADFTGEMMRKCINNIGSGQMEECFKICGFIKLILRGFLGCSYSGHKEIGRKLFVLKQSLAKMEMVCYNVRVRGSEIPKHMLALVSSSRHTLDDAKDDDEGFY